MEKLYYVNVSVSGVIAVDSRFVSSAKDAEDKVRQALSGSDDSGLIPEEIKESVETMLKQHIENGDIEIGDAFSEDEDDYK